MLSESCHPGSENEFPMTEEDRDEGAKLPRLRSRVLGNPTKPVIKKFVRQDEELKIDELGKRIKTLAEENQKRLMDDNSDDSFEKSINKRLKQESNYLTQNVSKGVPKTNGITSVQPLILKTNTESNRAFRCFDDKVIFRGEDKIGFGDMLKKHKHDNDEDTSSEDIVLGKKLILANLQTFLSIYAKKPVPKIMPKRSESNKSANRSSTPSKSTPQEHKSAKRSKSAAKMD